MNKSNYPSISRTSSSSGDLHFRVSKKKFLLESDLWNSNSNLFFDENSNSILKSNNIITAKTEQTE